MEALSVEARHCVHQLCTQKRLLFPPAPDGKMKVSTDVYMSKLFKLYTFSIGKLNVNKAVHTIDSENRCMDASSKDG